MRARRWLVTGVALGALFVPLPRSDAAPAQERPEEADSVLAIVSPIAFPACSVSGSASLLVPIVGGVVGGSLGIGDTVSVGDLVLDALGPVYLACGQLPAAPGRRCQLDADLGTLWPEQLATSTGPLPPVAGAAVDSVEAALTVLGLPPQAALADAFECSVPERPAPTPPFVAPAGPAGPAGSPSLESTVSGALPRHSAGSPAVLGANASPVPGGTGAVQGGARPSPPTLAAAIFGDRVPGPVLALQLLVAAALALFLGGSWVASLRLWVAERRP